MSLLSPSLAPVLMVPITKQSYNKIARQLATNNVLRKSELNVCNSNYSILSDSRYLRLLFYSAIFSWVGIAKLAGVAGMVAQGFGLLFSAVYSTSEDSEIDERPQPQHKQQSFVETIEEHKERAKSRLKRPPDAWRKH
jgi:hypothetical protein